MAEYPHYVYPQKMSWYDAERRQRFGSYYHYAEVGAQSVLNSADPTNIQTFFLDGTDTDYSHRNTVTLATLANDVTLEFSYYAREDNPHPVLHPEDHVIYVYGTVVAKDKDGHSIIDPGTGRPLETSVAISSNAYQWSTMDKIKVQYISSEVGYDTAGQMAYVNLFGTIYGPRYWENPNQPHLGAVMNRDQLQEQYSFQALNQIYDWSVYDRQMKAIEDAGDGTPVKPKKPEDDTSKPSPDPEPDYDPDPQPEPVPFPEIPDNDAMSTGFVHVYSPSMAELRAIAAKLWSDDFFNTIKKVQNDPMEAIISLHHLPFNPRSGTETCVIGNYNTGISVGGVAGQWYKRDLGSIYIPENWASALDYAPYVEVDCFIPYVGVRSLQVDDCIGKMIKIEMMVDIISGAAIAHVMCGSSVLYTFNTSLSGEVPVSQSSYAPLYNAIVGGMGNVLSGYGSAGAPGAAAAAVGSAINVAMGKQHSISRSGSIGGSTGCMGVFTPYLIIHRPIQSLASGFRHFKGYPSNITTSLGAISGYTEIESIHLDGIKCTEAERDEIRALLYNGVIF